MAELQDTMYEIVVGLEVHAQLLTESKLFCGDSAAFGVHPIRISVLLRWRIRARCPS
nr:hypothetical protein [Paraflavitalea speifideiaquila]